MKRKELIKSLCQKVVDGRLQRAMQSKDRSVFSFLSAHVLEFEKGFPHRDIFFWDHPSKILKKQKKLLRHLQRMEGYKKDLQKRGGLKTLKVRVKSEYPLPVSGYVDEKALLQQGQRWFELVEFVRASKESLSLKGALKLMALQLKALCSVEESEDMALEAEEFKEWVSLYVLVYALTEGGEFEKKLKLLRELEFGSIDYLAEEYMYTMALEQIGKLLPKPLREDFMALSHHALREKEHELKTISFVSSSDDKVNAGEELTILEVHPDQGIFRGFVGNDCSTAYSFGFPYSPFERVYYVFDSDHKVLGYVSASVVEAEESPALFLHTIAGPEIDFVHADMILRAFLAAKSQLGVESVFLPEDYRIGENINFLPIDKIMREHVKGQKLVPLLWRDAHYRSEIVDCGSASHYDDPKRNAWGRRLEVSVESLDVQVKERPFLSPRTKTLDHYIGE